MIKQVLKKISDIVHWFFYNFITPRQREFIKKLFTTRQRKFVKNLLKKGNKQARVIKIEKIKYKLQNLGFVERAYLDFLILLEEESDPYLKNMIYWELALWHANQHTKVDAEKCLDFLGFIDSEKNTENIKRVSILKAECFEILGEIEKAKSILEDALFKINNDADLYLAFANLESDEMQRLSWINKALSIFNISKLSLSENTMVDAYDRLSASNSLLNRKDVNLNSKVSIIVPVYNAENVIRTSINSLLQQTWENIEVLVVDDCSGDKTKEIIEEIQLQDKRVKLLQTDKNSGAYVARNIAITHATGEFITINDADDWSHPRKIEVQVLNLLKNPKNIGNTSQQARMTNDLRFYRRGKPGLYIFSNMSSFMFRKDKVINKIGFWDSVRFGADSEFIKRIKKVFGDKSIIDLETGPLSFQRQSSTSLTGNSAFGFPGYFMGARKEYLEAQTYYHSISTNLYYDFPQEERPFAVPEPMWSTREKNVDGRRHFDVIIVSDFRLDGGSTLSNLEEIKVHNEMGFKTGLIQMARYDYSPKKKINPKIREVIDGENVQVIVYGEKVSCDLMILRYPPILQEFQRYVPDVKANKICVIVNQTPLSDYGPTGDIRYEIKQCQSNLIRYFGNEGMWFPIGPQVRETLLSNHSDSLKSINLMDKDWSNVINIQEWKRQYPIVHGIAKIVIGRHSRDQAMKWPEDKEQLLSIYPDSPTFEIHILGGAEVPKRILGGELPSNWRVLKFGEIHPREFLQKIDVFVYYTNEHWVESFGRVIIEAMAVGVPVILPPVYKSLFREAAIYAEPEQVKERIKYIISNTDVYKKQVEIASKYVEKEFGYSKHITRLEELING